MMLAETTTLVIDPNVSGGGGSNNGASAAAAGGGHPRKKNSSITLVGRSRAGDATAFAIPELKWLFDCGAPVQAWTPRVIFLTHTHSDHVHFLTRVVVGDEKRHPPTVVLLPEEGLPFVEAHMRAYREMVDCRLTGGDGGDDDKEGGSRSSSSGPNVVLRPARAGEAIPISHGGTRFVVRTLKMYHRIPCLGYSIFKVQSRLKDEYAGLSGPEIGKLKKDGAEVTTDKEVPFLCFMGDTTARVFEDHPEVLRDHSVIVVECTFIDVGSKERAATTMHSLWDDLQPHIATHPGTMFVLTHFSLKYSALRLRNFFKDHQHIYDNVHPMLVDSEVERQWKASGEDGDVPRCHCRLCLPSVETGVAIHPI